MSAHDLAARRGALVRELDRDVRLDRADALLERALEALRAVDPALSADIHAHLLAGTYPE